MQCPSSDNLTQLTQGTLDETGVDEIERHLLACETCRISLAKIETTLDDPLSKRLRQSKIENDTKFDHVKIPGFRIVKQIGVGGMGTVFEAVDEKSGEKRAIKILHSSRHFDQHAVARFQREKEVIAKLKHPSIVKSFPYNGDKRTSLCIVMERLRGMDLGEYVKKHDPLSIDQARDFIVQAANGLHYAHESGIIHRDIKPSNLFVTELGSIKILDLGLARLSETDNDTTNTLTDQIVGTPDFLSPEQAVSPKSIDRRSDIYSLGCTFFYLLAGEAPFSEQETVGGKIAAHARDIAPNIRKLRPDVSPKIAAVLKKMLEKNPEKRFQTAAEAAEALTAKPSSKFLNRYWLVLYVVLLTLVCTTSVLYLSDKKKDDFVAAPAPIDFVPEPEILTVKEPKYYRVDGKQLLGPDGNPVFIRGFNVEASMNPNPKDVVELKEMGVKYIRYGLIFDFNGKRFEPDNLASMQKFGKTIKEQVELFTDEAIDVIVSTHPRNEERDLFRPWNNENENEEFKKLWQHIVDTLKDNPRIIGWDINRHPTWASEPVLTRWYEEIVQLIRKHDPHRPIFITSWKNGDFRNLGAYMVVSDRNIVCQYYSYFECESWITTDFLIENMKPILEFQDRYNIPTLNIDWWVPNRSENVSNMKTMATAMETMGLPWTNRLWLDTKNHLPSDTAPTELLKEFFSRPEKYNRNSPEFGKE